eukprot:scaffold586_cov155-Amphora_coffeaeformis.AAC.15
MTGNGSEVPYRLLAPLALVGLTDAISYMVTAPSIVFYVLANGGSYEAYGIILSSFSFSAFLFKPVLGYWCDKHKCFREPYLVSLTVASLGGLVYFMASEMQHSQTAIAFILMGRLMGGVGQANSTLGFTYVAQVVDKAALTQASSILSMVRILGMVLAPGLNVFLKGINTSITLGSRVIPLTPLNSVGLFLAVGNLLALFIIFFFLQETGKEEGEGFPVEDNDGNREDSKGLESKKETWWMSLLTIEVFVPLLSSFAMNANFQLLETGLAPVASDALGWGPVKISYIFGGNAILILFAILYTIYLSGKGVSNETLMAAGLIMSSAGYTLMYFMWTKPTTLFFFVLPVLLSTVCFPFLGSPTRSIFTMVVDSKPSLRNSQGTMQALMSMVVSVAGFTTPSFISSFVLRKPEEVDASSDSREFTPWALFAPLLSLTVLAGLLYVHWIKKPLETTPEKEVGESTDLLGDGRPPKWTRETYCVPSFDPQTTAARRESLCLMHIPQITYDDFQEAKNYRARRSSTGSVSIGHAHGYGQTRKSYFF